MSKGTRPSIVRMKSSLRCTMLYKDEYCKASNLSPGQVYSQKYSTIFVPKDEFTPIEEGCLCLQQALLKRRISQLRRDFQKGIVALIERMKNIRKVCQSYADEWKKDVVQ